MTAATLWSCAPCKINTTVLAVESISLSAEVAAIVHQHSGNEYPTLIAVPGAAPRMRLKTFFHDAWTLIGGGVLRATVLEMYLAKFTSLARDTGAAHTKIALASSAVAAIYISGASVSEDGILMADVDIVPLSADRITHPLALTNSVSLPTLAAQPVLHTMGSVKFNGSVIVGAVSSGVDFGVQYESVRTDGALYADVGLRVGAAPKCSAEIVDPQAALTSLGMLGTAISSSTALYFKRFDATTGVCGTANAVSITIASGRVHPDETPTDDRKVARQTISLFGTSSTSTHPFTVSLVDTAP